VGFGAGSHVQEWNLRRWRKASDLPTRWIVSQRIENGVCGNFPGLVASSHIQGFYGSLLKPQLSELTLFGVLRACELGENFPDRLRELNCCDRM
jgi:hypothetical protein